METHVFTVKMFSFGSTYLFQLSQVLWFPHAAIRISGIDDVRMDIICGL